MTGVDDLAKLVPGFEFLQSLMKNAGAATGIPGMGQWVAPTLNPEELDKRIQELKTVQFWLDNNAKLLGATIQALEVQRMTLTTLQTMNLSMTDLRDALTIKPQAAGTRAAATEAKAPAAPAPVPTPGSAATPAATAAIDPMQWWGALTQQFTELATRAVKDSGVAIGAVADGAGAAASGDAAQTAAADTAAAPRKRR